MANIQDFADYLNGKTTTFEGGAAWKMNLRESIAEFFNLGLLNGAFYQTQEDVMRDAAELFARAIDEEPEFAAKAAVYGHEKNSLKLVPVLALVYLSALNDKTLFNAAFPRIITNVNLLRDFVDACRKTTVRKGLGRAVKRAVNKRLFELANEYSVSRSKAVVSEIAKVSRPAFSDKAFQDLMRYAASGEPTFERARGLKYVIERIRAGAVDDDALTLIGKYHLQLEELKHALNDSLSLEAKQALYGTLYKGLRYAALILNLSALERVFAVETTKILKRGAHGAFMQKQVIKTDIPGSIRDMVCAKIKNIADYRKSNMLPFALINAERSVLTPEFKSALSETLEACAGEAFSIPADTEILVGVDISGSMTVRVSGSLSALDISSFLGALLSISHRKTRLCSISDDCCPVKFDYSDSLFERKCAIENSGGHGGTYLGTLNKHYAGEKFVIILTDSETADDFNAAWKNAARQSGAKLIVWQLAAYHIKLSNDPNVIYIAGFSDRILSLVKSIIEDTGNMLDEINSVVL